ncbi:MAG: YraN family protein [Pseudomonadota bacterium]
MAYLSGAAAEEGVARHYERSGHLIVERRWRGQGGEIDLIAQKGAQTVFIEVKQATDHATAAERLQPRQIARLFDSASEYMAGLPGGQNADVRFDVALVDGQGRIEILENALTA